MGRSIELYWTRICPLAYLVKPSSRIARLVLMASAIPNTSTYSRERPKRKYDTHTHARRRGAIVSFGAPSADTWSAVVVRLSRHGISRGHLSNWLGWFQNQWLRWGGGGSLSGRNPVRRNLAATALDFSTSTMNDPKMDGRRVSCARVKGRYADIFDLCSASR